MSILNKIKEHKIREIALKKQSISVDELTKGSLFQRSTNSLSRSIATNPYGIIGEHKRRSPSRPVINFTTPLDEIITTYDQGKVAGISVLTDNHFFGGSLEDLQLARAITTIPILRKEFIIDSYQIYEAKAYGADAILLIARILNSKEISLLTNLAHDMGLEVLLELHDESDLEKISNTTPDLIGINNRDLSNFETKFDKSIEFLEKIPLGSVRIAESGIQTPEQVIYLKNHGFDGCLIGETFMKHEKFDTNFKQFIRKLC